MPKTSILYWIICMLIFGSFAQAAEDFPGRVHKKYKMVPYIELDDLYAKRKDMVVVDARTPFEYDTLQIKDALNIPLSSKSFEDEVLALRKQTDKPIAFYCNGHTCMKSYQAVKKAMAVGVKDVYAYDAGIFDWAKAHPDEAVLLGKSPVDPKDIIPKKAFHAHLLNADKFSDLATNGDANKIILDIRDAYQRAGVGFFPGLERWTSLSKMDKVTAYMKKAKEQNKTLFIYDNVGKQVRWLQYALERHGVKKYYFMEKGAHGYYEMLGDASALQ